MALVKSWPRLILFNILLFFTIATLLFAGFEIYCRFFYDTTDSFGLTRVTERWFQRYYQYNRQGFRDNIDYALSKVQGKKRVTFLGDSFTAGHGVRDPEDRFANIIRNHKIGEWEVHVLATNGMDTGQEISLLNRIVGLGYGLEDVVLVYCLNDIADIVPEWKGILARIYGDVKKPNWFIHNSFFLNMFYFRFKASRDPDIFNYYQFVGRAYEGPLWAVQQERMKALNDFISSHGGRLRVVVFPFLHQLGAHYPYGGIHEKLKNFFTGIHVPYLELYDTYQDLSPQDVIVNRFDPHPNEKAHALAAEEILRFLESNP